MGLGWVFVIREDAGSYCIIGWIVLYHRLDRIVLPAGSYCIGWIGLYHICWTISGNAVFYALAGYCLYGTDGMDVLDGALVGQGWDVTTLAGARTGAPPLAP